MAQPRVVRLGSGVAAAISDDGASLVGSFGVAPRITVGSTIAGTALPGFTPASGSSDLSFLAGSTATGAARWNSATTTAQPLGVFASPPSNGSLSVKHISADGRYVVGWGYLSDGSSFRPWVWDAAAAGGAGLMVALPTLGNGQANVVGIDGTVAGVDGCCGSNNRPVYWRYNAASSAWVESYLPFDGGAAPITGGGVDAMNSAGTVIVGSVGLSSGSIDLARWKWSPATQSWDRTTVPRSAMVAPSWLPASYAPTQMLATGVSADGRTIVGIAVYTFFSSFIRGGFIWTESSGQAVDFYDTMVAQNAPVTSFGGAPPALGFPVVMTPDARHFATYAGPQTGFGPPTLIDLPGGPCVAPTAAAVNSTTSVAAGSNAYLNCSVMGSEPLSIQWRFNGNPISDGPSGTGSTYYGATGQGTIGVQLVIGGTTPADSGPTTVLPPMPAAPRHARQSCSRSTRARAAPCRERAPRSCAPSRGPATARTPRPSAGSAACTSVIPRHARRPPATPYREPAATGTVSASPA